MKKTPSVEQQLAEMGLQLDANNRAVPRPGGAVAPPPPPKPKVGIRHEKHREPNKTEAEFEQIAKRLWPGCQTFYEAVTLHIDSGRYTPDWMIVVDDRIVCLVETKGAHIHSAASIRAYKEARKKYPFFHLLFAQKTKAGWAYDMTELPQ